MTGQCECNIRRSHHDPVCFATETYICCHCLAAIASAAVVVPPGFSGAILYSATATLSLAMQAAGRLARLVGASWDTTAYAPHLPHAHCAAGVTRSETCLAATAAWSWCPASSTHQQFHKTATACVPGNTFLPPLHNHTALLHHTAMGITSGDPSGVLRLDY